MERFVCIHGHFYQPPRENPWLEYVEIQDSAYPYHDWNERVAAECYAPNAVSRILDPQGRIVRLLNNYGRISFDFGPTLLSWLERHSPEAYAAVLEADRDSRRRFSRHGSALALPYNHMILPLAARRDKVTQVRWGIADFRRRFGRDPEGMWLPETAVDTESLEVLAEHGIRFTILAPHQAARVRPPGGGAWRELRGGGVDPRRPYLARLPSGRSIALFFYDGPAARAVAFEGLLQSGDRLASRLLAAFGPGGPEHQLSHIATDGETYGHHHRYGEMALAYALHRIESGQEARLTNYGEFLERHAPDWEAQVVEATSWSCAHGVRRWYADCGCSVGARPGWNQAWRTPLRRALDGLRDRLEQPWERAAGALLRDPWAARDDYIELILDRSEERCEEFLARHAARPLDPAQRVEALKLLELQRHALLMYTSCGWFFDDLAGLEAVQVLRYAGRVIHLAEELLPNGHEERFLAELEPARSNVPAEGGAREVWERHVRRGRIDLGSVAAAYAMSSLYEPYGEETRLHCFEVRRESHKRADAGQASFAAGQVTLRSVITLESARLGFAVAKFGDHNLSAGVQTFPNRQTFDKMQAELAEAFDRADFPAMIRVLDHWFRDGIYTLKSIYPDMQRRLLERVLETTLDGVESEYRRLYEQHAPLLRYLSGLGAPLPRALHIAAEFVLNLSLRQALVRPYVDVELLERLLESARAARVALDLPTLGFGLEGALERLGDRLHRDPSSLPVLRKMKRLVALAHELGLQVNLWRTQNRYYELSQATWLSYRALAEQGEAEAREWVEEFQALGEQLGVRLD